MTPCHKARNQFRAQCPGRAAALWSILLAACIAGIHGVVTPTAVAAPPSGQIVYFDATNQTFAATNPQRLRPGKLTVIVQHVNTFREKYTITVQGTDLYGGTPDALKNLLAVNKRPPTSAGQAPAPDMPQFDRTKLPQDFLNCLQAVEQAMAALDYAARFDMPLPVSNDVLASLVRSEPDNYAIRKAVVSEIVRPLAGDGDVTAVLTYLTTPTARTIGDDLENFHTLSGERTRAAQKIVALFDGAPSVRKRATKGAALDAELQSWKKLYGDSQRRRALSSQEREEVDKADSDLSARVTALLESVQTGVRTARLEFIRLQDTFRAMSDPRLVPACVTKEVPALLGDVIKVSIKIEQTASPLVADVDNKIAQEVGRAGAAVSERTFPKETPLYGRWVMDFGAGIFVSSLRQSGFFIDPNGNDPNNPDEVRPTVQQGAKDEPNIGSAVIAHFYYTTPTGIGFGPAVGVGLADPPRILLGGSLVVGQRTRVALTYGAAFGKVTVLNGDKIGEKPLGSTLSTTPVLRQGTFWGLTLNINL